MYVSQVLDGLMAILSLGQLGAAGCSSIDAIHCAGYCEPGPLRPPFVKVPDNIVAGAKKRAAYWQTLCERTRPLVKELALA